MAPQAGTTNTGDLTPDPAGYQVDDLTIELAPRRVRRAGTVIPLKALSFDLLVTLGRLGVCELSAGQLMVGGTDEVTVGAKRVFGIGDSLILEARASAFARACDFPLAALDLGLYNWERGERAGVGLNPGSEPDPELQRAVQTALAI